MSGKRETKAAAQYRRIEEGTRRGERIDRELERRGFRVGWIGSGDAEAGATPANVQLTHAAMERLLEMEPWDG